jgi:hypothetical protein
VAPVPRRAHLRRHLACGGKEDTMNIPEFATVRTAVIQRNFGLCNEGAGSKDYLVTMASGDPGQGSSTTGHLLASRLDGNKWLS